MRIADLVTKKKQKVDIRVPTRLHDKYGTEAKGEVMELVRKGGVTMVKTKIKHRSAKKRGVEVLRPQDLTAS